MTSWFDHFLLRASHTRIHKDYCYKIDGILEHGCRCIAVALLLNAGDSFRGFESLAAAFGRQIIELFIVLCAYYNTYATYRNTCTYTQKHRPRLYGWYTSYEVRRCLFGYWRWIRHDNVVVVRSPAAIHRPHTCTLWLLAKYWSKATVASLAPLCLMAQRGCPTLYESDLPCQSQRSF